MSSDDSLVSRAFSKCTLSPYSDESSSSTPIVADSITGGWKTTSYYLDSSGRSSFIVPLQLGCASSDDRDKLLNSGCIEPSPRGVAADEPQQEENSGGSEDDEDEDHDSFDGAGSSINDGNAFPKMKKQPSTSSLKFEIKSHATSTEHEIETQKVVTVEGITILSSEVVGNSILFQTEVVVRAHTARVDETKNYNNNLKQRLDRAANQLRQLQQTQGHQQAAAASSASGGNRTMTNSTTSTESTASTSSITATTQQQQQNQEGDQSSDPSQSFNHDNYISTDLEITAVLSEKKELTVRQTIAPGLMALEMGAGGQAFSVHPSNPTQRTKISPAKLSLLLTHALAVSVQTVNGSSCGSTLVQIKIQHSNTHAEPVTITNIAMHPGHSREDVSMTHMSGAPPHKDRSMPGGQYYVTDMSKFVQWGYAPRTEPKLPLTLQPHDAYSTVLIIDAGEDLRSRFFVSPISVTAVVGKHHYGATPTTTEEEDTPGNNRRFKKTSVVVAADTPWTTGRVAVEPADAFRVDMSINQSECYVGAPLVVSLRVLNLSQETRDLMLLMAKDAEKDSQQNHHHYQNNNNYAGGGGGSNMSSTRSVGGNNGGAGNGTTMMHTNSATPQKSGSVNTAVVSEVNGYTFGVWGLSGDDDGTTRHNRDHELLAVDAALLLGEVKGQHSVDAELRFVPLREGTLDVPNLKLYDKMNGKWYNCVHMLKIVAATKKD
mmetsp:Transcript_7831/g.11958  ORF Transcript_7831/g.11958 Transcript_7831/m.11958 type:complete len:716 (+) Transcript_7831:47-2194(+)|eukprot:CAMPEP_0195301536 /NCGR_PEP_ID=MMETSP0707-20130614/29443_1 /TAXON_ID=33640 /ORGANISM="Asterionellopsis glacialis, Strain CCMP134" /LENGTH=715 /DNA_ID=CAMNT_0040364499 /DNA_START=42 /DNA_END=2189 /DNA_ORIENTATION=+